jgi:exopolysaccharide biosynthesis protein
MCNGQTFGQHMLPGYKRLELHEDNLIYIRDAGEDVAWDCTDAVEFSPAMIIDGNIVVDDRSGFSDLQPRACIGQSQYGEILMLLVEGRLHTVSLGISVPDCAVILSDHKCAQAMNLDGGTSAMVWYKGDYIMKSSNPVLQAGRTLPNAFVYESID